MMQTCGRRRILLAVSAAVLQKQPWHRRAPVIVVRGETLTLVIFWDSAACYYPGGMIREWKPHITSQSIETLTLGFKKVPKLTGCSFTNLKILILI